MGGNKRTRVFGILIISAAAIFFFILTHRETEAPVVSLHNSTMKITSTAFIDNEDIPQEYTCDGKDVGPVLAIESAPGDTASLAVIMHDPDAPRGSFLHWSAWNIAPDTTTIDPQALPGGVIQGMTDFGRPGYGGPCPPSGTHRYIFTVYALDEVLNPEVGSSLKELEEIFSTHAITTATLTGLYERQK